MNSASHLSSLTDPEVVIKELISEEESFTSYGHILASAKFYTNAYSFISFSHMHKLGNSLAHNLTKHARHIRGFLLARNLSNLIR